MALNREELLQKLARKPKSVTIEGLGDVNVLPLSGRSRALLVKFGSNTPDDLTARIVADCVVDDNNKRIFTDKDIESLIDADSNLVEEMTKQIFSVSGLLPDAVEQEKKD